MKSENKLDVLQTRCRLLSTADHTQFACEYLVNKYVLADSADLFRYIADARS